MREESGVRDREEAISEAAYKEECVYRRGGGERRFASVFEGDEAGGLWMMLDA